MQVCTHQNEYTRIHRFTQNAFIYHYDIQQQNKHTNISTPDVIQALLIDVRSALTQNNKSFIENELLIGQINCERQTILDSTTNTNFILFCFDSSIRENCIIMLPELVSCGNWHIQKVKIFGCIVSHCQYFVCLSFDLVVAYQTLPIYPLCAASILCHISSFNLNTLRKCLQIFGAFELNMFCIDFFMKFYKIT